MPAPRTPVEKALDAIYAELPTISCQGRCQASCHITSNSMTAAERDRIEKRTGATFRLPLIDRPCTLLSHSGHCKVYGARPLICRLWGVVDSMKCPYGCTPDPRYLTHDEGHDLLRRARELGGSL